MTVIDPTTPLGKIRLRIGDWSDLVILPDSVIDATLDDCGGNLPRTAMLCAQYILATLTYKTHKKLAQIETWPNEQFKAYVEFLKLVVLNPNFTNIAPVPYAPGVNDAHPIIEFVEAWNADYANSIPTPVY